MNQHGPTCLDGPVTKSRTWWRANGDEFSALEPRLQPPADGIRGELVERVRREIAAGTYENEDKLEIALAKLFQAIDVD
jgi:hypothetical protein